MPKLTNQIVIEKAKQLGFDLVGFAKADLLKNEVEKLESWLGKELSGINGVYGEKSSQKKRCKRNSSKCQKCYFTCT